MWCVSYQQMNWSKKKWITYGYCHRDKKSAERHFKQIRDEIALHKRVHAKNMAYRCVQIFQSLEDWL